MNDGFSFSLTFFMRVSILGLILLYIFFLSHSVLFCFGYMSGGVSCLFLPVKLVPLLSLLLYLCFLGQSVGLSSFHGPKDVA